MTPELFHIAPVAQKSSWISLGFGIFLVLMFLLLLGALLFAWRSVHAAKHATFQVDAQGLHVRCFPYSRTLPWESLHLEQAKTASLVEHATLGIRRRIAGTSLGSVRAGWFRLRNDSKALAVLTRQDHVAVIPTDQEFTLLLSVAEPERFLTTLRTLATSP